MAEASFILPLQRCRIFSERQDLFLLPVHVVGTGRTRSGWRLLCRCRSGEKKRRLLRIDVMSEFIYIKRNGFSGLQVVQI